MRNISLLAIVGLSLLAPLTAQSTPINYRASYEITTGGTPASSEWGDTAPGTALYVDFTWDADIAAPIPIRPDIWDPSPFALYVMTFGSTTIYSGSIITYGSPGAAGFGATDITPHTCTVLNPCGTSGEWWIDDIFFSFRCADASTIGPGLPQNLSCNDGYTGDVSFETQTLASRPGGIHIEATLRDVKEVPEPSTLTLFASALLAARAIGRRKTNR